MATRKVVIEVEVPEELRIGEGEVEAMRSAARRALIYMILEKYQRREPTREELEELVRKVKEGVYRSVVEEEG